MYEYKGMHHKSLAEKNKMHKNGAKSHSESAKAEKTEHSPRKKAIIKKMGKY